MPTPTEQGIYYFSQCEFGTAEWHGPCAFNDSHAREIGVPLDHMTVAHCTALIDKWNGAKQSWNYSLRVRGAKTPKTAKVSATHPNALGPEEIPPPKLQTWGSVYLDGKIADHLLTVQRIKDAGYTFTNRPHPDVSTRNDYYQYELYVIFDLYNLGTYTPA